MMNTEKLLERIVVIGLIVAVVALFIYTQWYWEPVIDLGEWWDWTAHPDWGKP